MKTSNLGHFKPREMLLQWDEVVRGLGVRLNREGTRNYIAKLSYKGKQRWFTIGPYELIELDEARKLVVGMKIALKAGSDPAVLLEQFLYKKVVPENYGMNFKDFANYYIENIAKAHKKSWLKDRQRIDLYLMPLWKDRPITSITKMEVAAIHKSIGKDRPVAANRLLETISVMWKQAAILGHIPDEKANIILGIRRYKEKPRDRFLSKEEWVKLLEALETTKGEKFQKEAIKLDLELGFRHSEIVALKWDYVDLERREIRLPDTKSGRPFRQPLTDKAVQILSDLPRFNQWVFPSTVLQGNHISAVEKLLKRVCKNAGIEDFRVHDIRRSVGCSVLAATGSLEMVAAVLNHTSYQTTKTYAMYHKDHVRKALEQHSQSVI